MPVINSTEYYRMKKEAGVVMHRCPHCEFTTPYNKSNLMNHIYAKHTPENKRPFQCDHCERGFSQKSNLLKHMKKEHNIQTTHLEKKITNILYKITLTDKIPRSKKTKSRREYYKKHKLIKSRDMRKKKHEYFENCYLCNNDLHYDERKGFIQLHKIPLMGLVTTNTKFHKCKILFIKK